MSPAARKLVLTAHITSSVGWFGAVAAFTAVAAAALATEDAETVRAAYVAMDVTAWFAIVPLALASLATGVAQSLAGAWGLVRHYWVVFKLAINVFAALVLLLYMQTLGGLAETASDPAAATDDLLALRSASPVIHGAGALVLLLAATVLAVYKPRGVTPWGRRERRT